MIVTLQFKRGTSAEWAAADPVLEDGEPGKDTDTGTIKVGDGVTAWSALPSITSGADDLQPLDDDLTAIANLASAADKMPYATGAQAWALTDLTPLARDLLAADDENAMQTVIGAGTSNLAIGVTATDAKRGDYAPTLADLPAGSRFACPIDGSVTTNVNLARPSSRLDIFFDWNSTVLPNNMKPGDKWDQVQ